MKVHSTEIDHLQELQARHQSLKRWMMLYTLNCLIRPLKEDTKRNWNSVKMINVYIGYGDSKRSRVRLIKYVSEYFGDDLVVLSSPGIASIILFCSTASIVLKLVDEEDDDLDVKSPRRSRRKLRTFQLIHFTMKPK